MLPVLITLRDIPVSPTLESSLKKKAEKLSIYCQRILRCRILVTLLQKHQRHGQLYNVQIELSVPGKQLAAKNKPVENINVAIREAFEALRRQLEHHVKKRNHHPSLQHHRTRLLADQQKLSET